MLNKPSVIQTEQLETPIQLGVLQPSHQEERASSSVTSDRRPDSGFKS